MKRSHLLATACAATALLLTGCSSAQTGGSGSASSQDAATTVDVAVLGPGSLQWLHAIAKDQGFYDDHGVTVQDVQVQNSGALVQAVASGSADAGIALGDSVIKAVDQGAGVTITGALIQKPALRLYGGVGVTSAQDLAGAAVTAGATEGGTYDLLVHMLAEEGVDTSSLTPVAIANSSDRVTALGNGQVDGALLIPPFNSLATSQGATELGWYDGYWLETPSVVNTAWAEENPDAARGFTQGLADAAEFFADPANEQAAVTSLVDYAGTTPEAAAAAYEFIQTNQIFSPDLDFPDEALTNVAAISAEVNGTDLSGWDVSKYYDKSYLG